MNQLWSTAPLHAPAPSFFDPWTHAMHLHAAGAVHLQYFMPRHQPHHQEATNLQAQLGSSSAVCRRSSSSSTSPPATTMWEYHQAAHAAALQTASPSAPSFPSWSSSYAGTTAALLGSGSAFTTDAASSPPDLRLPASAEHGHGYAWDQHGEQ